MNEIFILILAAVFLGLLILATKDKRLILAAVLIALAGIFAYVKMQENTAQEYPFVYEEIDPYTDSPYAEINGNRPYFTDEDMNMKPFEAYGETDSLHRCTAAEAMLSKDMMPQDEREDISTVRPTGFKGAVYEIIGDGYLYHRCHLIAFELTGQNANERNLITGTAYMNLYGMEPFENQAASYIRRTGNHVRYRVTPVFIGSELVARGVLMEAQSLEDDALCFCVFCYNVQPGITIDYRTGDSRLSK